MHHESVPFPHIPEHHLQLGPSRVLPRELVPEHAVELTRCVLVKAQTPDVTDLLPFVATAPATCLPLKKQMELSYQDSIPISRFVVKVTVLRRFFTRRTYWQCQRISGRRIRIHLVPKVESKSTLRQQPRTILE